MVINYKTFLMGRCRKLTHGNLHDANDLFSRVMLKVCSESPQQLRQVRHMGGWLSRIAYNQFIDDQRERQADARRDGGLSYLSETIGLSALSAEQEYLNAELSHQLGLAFEALPERLRRAAYMRFCEDAPYDRIAADLAITPANARKHIQEARRLLGARVRRYVGNELLPQRAPGRSATLSLLHYAE
nr:sigma-70 family RNA polymerase sigma factor [Duganella sp. 1224]